MWRPKRCSTKLRPSKASNSLSGCYWLRCTNLRGEDLRRQAGIEGDDNG
jgi:hypothetical protein